MPNHLPRKFTAPNHACAAPPAPAPEIPWAALILRHHGTKSIRERVNTLAASSAHWSPFAEADQDRNQIFLDRHDSQPGDGEDKSDMPSKSRQGTGPAR